ncbi:hypothetical protein [uncultured Muribaculum sp.]|uniref:hypothetical protein n=1 Tax=uncultured Muribaculum sp. TaxID=1918613 RepID=UPI00267605FE|nr:hypothetical protein [uncultured Muribaculum sp.]
MVYFHNEIIKVRIWLPDLRQLWNVFIPNLLRERAVRFFLLEKVFKKNTILSGLIEESNLKTDKYQRYQYRNEYGENEAHLCFQIS